MYYDLLGSVGYQLTAASRVNERNIERTLEEFGLTRISWIALVAVGDNSLSQPSRIADFLGIDRPVVSRALRSLETNGLINRSHTNSDGRRVFVQVTAAGTETLRSAAPKIRACNEALVQSLAPAEREILLQLMLKVNTGRPKLRSI